MYWFLVLVVVFPLVGFGSCLANIDLSGNYSRPWSAFLTGLGSTMSCASPIVGLIVWLVARRRIALRESEGDLSR